MGYRVKYIKPFLIALALLATSSAHAFEAKGASAAFATPNFGAGFVTLTSDTNDTLTSLSAPCCDNVELHTSSMKDGIMSMRKLDSLALSAGKPVAILGDHGTGDSMHIMFINAHQPMKPGQHFPVTFHFAKQQPQTVRFTVAGRTAKASTSAPAAASH